MSTYEERLAKARAYNREWNRARGDIGRAEGGLKSFLSSYGQRVSPATEYKRQREERLAAEAGRTPSLPSVSILSSDIDVSVQDYRAGLLARREARL